jgi:hypothetical protein
MPHAACDWRVVERERAITTVLVRRLGSFRAPHVRRVLAHVHGWARGENFAQGKKVVVCARYVAAGAGNAWGPGELRAEAATQSFFPRLGKNSPRRLLGGGGHGVVALNGSRRNADFGNLRGSKSAQGETWRDMPTRTRAWHTRERAWGGARRGATFFEACRAYGLGRAAIKQSGNAERNRRRDRLTNRRALRARRPAARGD